MHFHPFGIPVDEVVKITFIALQTPVSVYVDSAVQCMHQVRGFCTRCAEIGRRKIAR